MGGSSAFAVSQEMRTAQFTAPTTILNVQSSVTTETMYAQYVQLQLSATPIFYEAPVQVDRAYTSVDSKTYYILQARVGKRKNNPNVPDVFIDHKDDKYILQVTFDLLRNAAIAQSAQQLPLDNFTVTLHESSGGATSFAQIQILPAPDNAPPQIMQQLLAQTEVDLNHMLGVLQTDVNAWFEVRANVHYRIQSTPVVIASPNPINLGIEREVLPSSTHMEAMHIEQAATFSAPIAELRPRDDGGDPIPDHPRPPAGGTHTPSGTPPSTVTQPAQGAVAQPAPTITPPARVILTPSERFNTHWINQIYYRPPVYYPPPTDVLTTNVLLTTAQHDGVGAYFPPNINPYNNPIYAKVSNLPSDVDTFWQPFGDDFFRASAIPNQYYILPDSYGLNFDAALSLPEMSVLLHQTDDGQGVGASSTPSYRIRVGFGVVPHFDPNRLERIRTYLSQQYDIAYADLVVGGYETAVFDFSHLLDQLGSTVVGSAPSTTAITVDAAHGFELVLDCTIEFYTLLAQILTNPGKYGLQGFQGNVTFTLKMDNASPNPTLRPRDVQVVIRLDKPANHPLLTRLDSGSSTSSPVGGNPVVMAGPQAMFISNPSNVEVSVGKVLCTLLVMDQYMPYAINAAASTATPAALDLQPPAPGTAPSEARVTFTPPQSLAVWNAVAVSFADVLLKLDAATVLNRVHQLSPPTSEKSTVHVESYPLKHPEVLPPALTGLIGLQVEIKRGDAVLDVYLSRDNSSQQAQIAFTLNDVLAGMSPDQLTFQWRRRNLFATSTGDWSDYQTNTGSDLFVTPVPPPAS